MSTRAAQAATSQQAKQNLVRILFGKQYSRGGPEAHRKLDPSIYNYTDLRKAYLDRLQSIHPDKVRHQQLLSGIDSDGSSINRSGALSSTTTFQQQHFQFVELQDAWDRYEQFAKMMHKAEGRRGTTTANFTKFGVGCSFSDTPEERAMRDEITDQACRGWFSSGSLGYSDVLTTEDDKISKKNPVPLVSLSDDDLFEEQSLPVDSLSFSKPSNQPKPSLIPKSYRQRR